MSHSAERILEEWSDRQGWNEATQIKLLLEYIENQADNATFNDFLARKADLEDEMGEDAGEDS